MEYLSTQEAADYLGYTLATFKRYVADRKILPDVRVGNSKTARLGFTKTTLDAFRASRKGTGRPGRNGHSSALTEEEWATAGRRFHAGESLRMLAEEYGVSHTRIFQKAGPRGGPRTGGRRPGGWKLTSAEWAEAKRRYQAGEPLRQVAADYAISAQHLHKKVGPREKPC